MTTTIPVVTISGLRQPQTIPLGLKKSVGKSLRPAIQKLANELKPEKIILFGSYAYGIPTPHSDVDLLVILKTNAPLKERSWKVSRLLLPRPFPVDILVLQREFILLRDFGYYYEILRFTLMGVA